jgi:hypothetical protein
MGDLTTDRLLKQSHVAAAAAPGHAPVAAGMPHSGQNKIKPMMSAPKYVLFHIELVSKGSKGLGL